MQTAENARTKYQICRGSLLSEDVKIIMGL